MLIGACAGTSAEGNSVISVDGDTVGARATLGGAGSLSLNMGDSVFLYPSRISVSKVGALTGNGALVCSLFWGGKKNGFTVVAGVLGRCGFGPVIGDTPSPVEAGGFGVETVIVGAFGESTTSLLMKKLTLGAAVMFQGLEISGHISMGIFFKTSISL